MEASLVQYVVHAHCLIWVTATTFRYLPSNLFISSMAWCKYISLFAFFDFHSVFPWIFLSSGPFIFVPLLSILRMILSILREKLPSCLSLCWDSNFREVFSFVFGTLLNFFLSSYLIVSGFNWSQVKNYYRRLVKLLNLEEVAYVW